MNKSILALAFALCAFPISALAQDSNAAAAPTSDQRQQMHQMMQQFGQQEETLHEQLRGQVLSTLTPLHRRAIAVEIGNLAVSENPDPNAAVQRIDRMLSSRERSQILRAHEAFAAQSRQVHQQMMSQIQQMMPTGHSPKDEHSMDASMRARMNDPGWIVLHALPPHSPMMGMGHMGMGGDHMGGAPPR
jgi:hypothetical protein